MTVVITFHYLDGIEYLSDRILLLEKGELIEDRPIEDFLSMRRNAVSPSRPPRRGRGWRLSRAGTRM